jgi:hypothetical protein
MKLLAQTNQIDNRIDFGRLKQAFPGNSLPANSDLSLGLIISKLLPYVFVLSGLALLVYLIFGGFLLMTSGGDPKKVETGKGAVTNAIIGFLIIFAAYWLVQIVQMIFGLPKIF